ncbi:putative pentatricopeptide repeat-containing protein At5g52630 isoform X2 [Nymphaea colorata]|nr:putative pentatricopeptide repeat-containing protein At5g52630 isoform X2 [Nymphaea colorata]
MRRGFRWSRPPVHRRPLLPQCSVTRQPYATSALSPSEFNSLLNAITNNGCSRCASQAHAQIVKNGLVSVPFLHRGLMNMYAKCGLLEEGLLIFHGTDCNDVISWTTIITALCQSSRPLEALSFFSRMRQTSVSPNHYTFSAILPACADIGALPCGKQLHSLIHKSGFASDIFVASALIGMYSRLMDLEDARKVFVQMPERSIVSWNTMIVGCNHSCMYGEAFELFYGMLKEGIMPDQVSLSSVFSACASARCLTFGIQVHALVLKFGLEYLVYVRNAIIDMYSKCGSSEVAIMLFGCNASFRDIVTWNVMMMGWAESEKFEETCKYFWMMRDNGIVADEVSLSTVLHACASLAALDQGTVIHNLIIKSGFAYNACVRSSLTTFYAKCGSLSDAYLVFNETMDRNVIIWTSMISACQLHGLGYEVIKLFNQMVSEGIKPDYVTYVCVLSACSHNGLVEEGLHYFRSMTKDHGLRPGYEHYSCVVDLLGRDGQLVEARRFIESMPMQPDASVWGALLAACRNFGNVEIAKEVAERLFEIEPYNSGNYVLLANIYMSKGMLKQADEVRKLMKENGVKKETACSWIEARNITYVFTACDKSHTRSREIYEMIQMLVDLVKPKGYAADKQCAVNDVGDDSKEKSLWYHSEKLALAFGLLTIPDGAPIRIKKNLRICGDCHTFMKLISESLEREIIIRDINRFHRFSSGICSCKDFW